MTQSLIEKQYNSSIQYLYFVPCTLRVTPPSPSPPPPCGYRLLFVFPHAINTFFKVGLWDLNDKNVMLY